jgi:hypothetical protein
MLLLLLLPLGAGVELLVVGLPPMALGWLAGPLAAGVLALALGWTVEPFAAARLVWLAGVAALVAPAVLALAGLQPAALAMLAALACMAGGLVRGWRGEIGAAFAAGICGGVAIALSPASVPVVLLGFGALAWRGVASPLGSVQTAMAAGLFDTLGFILAFDSPPGGFLAAAGGRLSIVHVALAFLLLLAAALGWRLEKRAQAWARHAADGLLPAAALLWVALFPRAAWAALAFAPVVGGVLPGRLLPGLAALAYALWRAQAGRARRAWGYLACCLAAGLTLGVASPFMAAATSCMAAALLPLALSEASLRFTARAGL